MEDPIIFRKNPMEPEGHCGRYSNKIISPNRAIKNERMAEGWKKGYILCAVVLMSMVPCISCMGGAKGPGEAAHVEEMKEGQREKLPQK